MVISSRVSRRGLLAGAALAALTLVTALTGPMAEGSVADRQGLPVNLPIPSTLTADQALAQITAADGALRFDVAEDGKRFVWAKQPVFNDGLPAHGNTYISQGYIYPEGTLSDTIDGVNADGSPEFPDLVLGQWSCYGWYIGDAAHATEGPWVLSTQMYDFGSAWGEATLVSEGYVLANTGGAVQRAITGGTGPFANVRGEMVDTNLGFNETAGGNARYEVRLLPAPDFRAYVPTSKLEERPLRGA